MLLFTPGLAAIWPAFMLYSLCKEWKSFGTFYFSTSLRRFKEREFCLRDFFLTRPVLFFSSPAKTGCCQMQCKWEYTYSGRDGGRRRERGKEGGNSQNLNNEMPHWTLVPHTNLSLIWTNQADWRCREQVQSSIRKLTEKKLMYWLLL